MIASSSSRIAILAIALAGGCDAGTVTHPDPGAGATGLSWLAPATNADGTPLQDLAGFKLHCDTTSRGGDATHSYAHVVDLGEISCAGECQVALPDLGSLGAGKVYVTVSAYDHAVPPNESAYSNEVSITNGAPSASLGLLAATQPKLMSQADIVKIAGDAADWAARKSWCDGHLDDMIGPGYVGWDWHDAVVSYAACYNVARHLGLAAGTVQGYADKLLALMRVMARDQVYGTPRPGQELLAVGDGATKTFTLRMPPAAGETVRVFLASLRDAPLTYSGADLDVCDDYCFDPIVSISDGAASYVRSVDYHEGYPNHLHWLGAKHPAGGASFTARIADGTFATAAGATVNGTTLTLASAPAASQAVFVEYLGPAYAQTGKAMGGVESIRPDSCYPMRSMNVGLAWGFDTLRVSAELTPALRAEYSALLAAQVDAYMETTGMNPYLNDPLSNYFTEGELTGALCTALAIDDDVTTTPHGRQLTDLARSLLLQAHEALDEHIPGGYGFEGTYTNGAAEHLLNVFSIWKNATGEDLAPQLEWTTNLVPATIHGIKPDRETFYDGGDWNTLPATPLTGALQAFVHYQADHPMAPFARQALADVGEDVSGPMKDYKSGPDAFPRSLVTKGTGALYARSDWGTGAVWMSMSVGPVFSLGHQHLDRGHITIQRGADYLLKDSGDYGAYDTVPWHNTLGFGNSATPSQCGGDDGGQVAAPRYLDAEDFVYAREDLKKSYCGNGVSKAIRTVVYLRPDLIVVHDVAQTGDAATKKQLNLNFGAAISGSGPVFSTAVGGSKLFMRSLVPADPAPVITPAGTSITGANGAFELKGENYRVTTSGQTADTFLNVFQATSSGQAQMAATTLVASADGRAHGAAIDAGGNRWLVLSSVSGAQLTGALAYGLPVVCPCAHVVADLEPGTTYRVDLFDGTGAPIGMQNAATGPQGVLSFTTAGADVKQVTLTAAGTGMDTTPPTVSLTAPAGGATVSGTITLAATASDGAGTGVTQVRFLVDGDPVGTDTTAPYTFVYDTTAVDNAAHAFAAVAVDGAGNSATSAAVSATVDNMGPPVDTTPPTVSLTEPAGGATVSGTITLAATAADPGSGVAQVEFLVDGATAGSDTTAPYTLVYDTTALGDAAHTFAARATDGADNAATSAAVTVTVDNVGTPVDMTPPTVSLTAPAGGATVSGTVTLAATAADPGSGVTQVQFLVDGAPAGSDTAAPYTMAVDTTALGDGAHTFAARATDGAGNAATSAAVSVTVSNTAPPVDTTPPTVSLTAPAAGATVSGTITVTAAASDVGTGVSRVELYVDDTRIAEDTAAPYGAGYDTTQLSDGTHVLRARAFDGAGHETLSDPVTVTVTNAVAPPVDTLPPAAPAGLKVR